MSWSATVAKTPVVEFPDAVRAARIDTTYASGSLAKQWNDQLHVAQDAALAVFESNAFGEGGSYSASFSGHANHNGDDETYAASEYVSITVNRHP